MAGIFPEAADIYSFYQNLCEGKESTRELSYRRIIRTSISDQIDYQHFSYIEDIDTFDYEFFNIPPGEAINIDPHQRKLLEVVYHAIENAGYTTDDLDGANCSVYVGDTDQQYAKHLENADPTAILGNLNAGAAGRIARQFNLTGNAAMIDTACSSSLVAVHFACNDLLLNESDYSIACGVKFYLFPAEKNFNLEIEILSNDGRTRTFSNDANGCGRGEAVGCVLLKRYSDAVRDGDLIHAIIRSSAVNQDAGRSSNLAAPSSVAQSEVLQRAWKKASIDPSSIGYIEVHGTGTRIGDPIEIEAITQAFSSFTLRKQFCAVSALKTNIGHTDSAAGISGLIKAVLALKYERIFPSLNFSHPNKFINFIDSPVYVNTKLQQWISVPGVPRTAGVSAFGLSGTNCHVVVQSHEPRRGLVAHHPKYLMLLSSHHPEGLSNVVTHLSTFLQSQPQFDTANLSYTLAAGRKHYHYRKAFVVDSIEDFVSQLKALPEQRGFKPLILRQPSRICVLGLGWTEINRNDKQRLLDHYPFIRQMYESHLPMLPSGKPAQLADSLLLQCSIVLFLQQLGITVNEFVGCSVPAETLLDLIDGKITLSAFLHSSTGNQLNSRDEAMQSISIFMQQRSANANRFIIDFADKSFALRNIFTDDARICRLKDSNDSSNLLELLRELYEAGINADWSQIFGNEPMRLVDLPPRPFNNTRCWIKKPASANVGEWLYSYKWVKKIRKQKLSSQSVRGLYIAFTGASKLEPSYLKFFENAEVVTIRPGVSFKQFDRLTFEIDYGHEDHYEKLKAALVDRLSAFSGVLYLCHPGNEDIASKELEAAVNENVIGAAMFCKVFHNEFKSRSSNFYVVTRMARKVLNSDKVCLPFASMMHGFVCSLLEEYPAINVKCVDVEDYAGTAMDQMLSAEHLSESNVISAYRDSRSYVPMLTRAVMRPAPPDNLYHDGETYLVTGGTNGVGLELIRHIGSSVSATLFVIGRRRLPPKELWAQYSAEIEALEVFLEVERKGCEVFYYSSDLGDLEETMRAYDFFKSKRNHIDGILHAAGIPGTQLLVDHSALSFRETLAPKVFGAVYLHMLCKDEPLKFFLLFSSLNAIIGAEKNCDYSAANSFLDSYAEYLRQQGINASSINWPAWREVGLWRRFFDVYGYDREAYALGIRSAHGFEAMAKAFSCDHAQVIVNRIDPSMVSKNAFFDVDPQYFSGQAAPNPLTRSSDAGANTLGIHDGINQTHVWDDVEEVVRTVWSEVLKMDKLDNTDNFFSLGGHSLLGVRIINRLEKLFNVGLQFRDVLKHPTIASLSVFILSRRTSHEKISGSIFPIEEQQYYNLSFQQKSLWLSAARYKDQISYNIPIAVRLNGNLNISLLKQALEMLWRRHESLRTGFRLAEGEIKQFVHDVETICPFTELKDTPVSEINTLVDIEIKKPFDILRDPMLRCCLMVIDQRSSVLVLTLHHIIADGISVENLLRDLVSDYNRALKGDTTTNRELTLQFKDFAAYENRQVKNGSMERSLQYWQKRLQSPAPRLDFLLNGKRPPPQTNRGDVYSAVLSRDLSVGIVELGKKHKASLFSVLLAFTNALLFRFTLSEDIMIGTPLDQRRQLSLEDQIGLFLNNIAIRTQFTGAENFENLLVQIVENLEADFEHQGYPFYKLLDALGIVTERGRSPIYDVVIVVQQGTGNQTALTDESEDIVIEPQPCELNASNADLRFVFVDQSGELTIHIEYNTEVFNREFIQNMSGAFTKLIDGVLQNPSAPLHTFEMSAHPATVRKLNPMFNFEFNN